MLWKIQKCKNYDMPIIGLALLAFSAVFSFCSKFFTTRILCGSKRVIRKIVKADTAIWSINFEVKSNNVDTLYADIDKNVTTIKSFLTERGFEASEINVAPVNIYQDTYKDALFQI